MSHEEAIEWMRGNRSCINNVPPEPRETWCERIAQADAALAQQAYWVLKAHHEGLVK